MSKISRRIFVGGMAAATTSLIHPFANASELISQIKFMTEEYPPFNYSANGELRGIAADIMVEILKRTDTGLGRGDIEMLPWARGYNLTLKKKNHALFSTTLTDERRDLFKWVGPFAPTVVGLTARKDRKLTITDPSDMSKLRIGVVKDDVGHLLLIAAGVPASQLDVVLSNDLNYKKLISGRIDAISYGAAVTKWGLKSMGENLADYEIVHELKRGSVYLALNPQIPDSVVDKLQASFDGMVKDGTHQTILARYLGQE